MMTIIANMAWSKRTESRYCRQSWIKNSV